MSITSIDLGLVPLNGSMFGIKLSMAKSRNTLPVTDVVMRSRATSPLVAIPAMALILVPQWRSRRVVGVIPQKAYPYFRIQFLWSEPVSSTKTNMSGWNIRHCVVYAPHKVSHCCSATCLIFLSVIPQAFRY